MVAAGSSQVEILAVVDQLNQKYPELELTYDSITGKLNLQRDAIQEVIDKTKESAITQAAQNNLIQSYQDMFKVEDALYETTVALAAARADLAEESEKVNNIQMIMGENWVGQLVGYQKAKSAVEELEGTYTDLQGSLASLNTEVDNTISRLGASTGEVSGFTTSMTAGVSQIKTAVDENLVGMEQVMSDIGDVFINGAKASGDAAEEVAKAIIDGLYERRADGYYDAGTQTLVTFTNGYKDSEDGLYSSIDSVMSEVLSRCNISSGMNTTGLTAMQSLTKSIQSNAPIATSAAEKMAKDLLSKTRTQLGINGTSSTVTSKYGQYLVNGLSEGIDYHYKDVDGSIDLWTNRICQQFTSKMQINSPSKLFAQYGAYLVEGGNEGIESTMSGASVEKWCAILTTTFKNLSSSFTQSLNNWMTTSTTSYTTWITDHNAAMATFYSEEAAAWLAWLQGETSAYTTHLAYLNKEMTTGNETMQKTLNTGFDKISELCTKRFKTLAEDFTTWRGQVYADVEAWVTKIGNKISDMTASASRSLSNLLSDLSSAASKVSSTSINVNVSGSTSRSTTTPGHALGGVFNREHYARFAEGNKAEAIIPLENASAMQPFVDAVADGITQSLAPIIVQATSNSNSNSSSQRPLYVGTLIADNRGLRELQKKMAIIEIQENSRKGLG